MYEPKMPEPSFNELRRLERAISNHGQPFKGTFDLLMDDEPARSHNNYKRVLEHCWVKLKWRPNNTDTRVYVARG